MAVRAGVYRAAGRVGDSVGRVIATAARGIDSLYERGGLAPPRLELPSEVVADLSVVFGTSVDPGAVVIRLGHFPGVPHSRAWALPGLIYLASDPGVVHTGRLRATPTLVHELVHVWQGRHVGPRYVVEALWEQARLGRRAYDWRVVLAALDDDDDDTALRSLEVEAFAELVTDAAAVGEAVTARRRPASSERERALMTAALAALRAGGRPGHSGCDKAPGG